MKKYTLDWNRYIELAIQMSAEGCVLLKNDKKVLPFSKEDKIAVFGRIAAHYYKSGTGSGGKVNVSHVVDIIEALKERGASLNEELLAEYAKWEESNPIDEGMGWGNEPWSQEEMPLSDDVVKRAAEKSNVALVVIGRTAGEDKDNSDIAGSYRLSDAEEDMLFKVSQNFDKVCVVLNVGNLVDMNFVNKYKIGAVMYIWHAGMVGAYGGADVILGNVSPSGKLTDTIAYSIDDYPSTAYFGDKERNFYSEDVFVGYRYFETYAQDKVMYPFGYGLSYTNFNINAKECTVEEADRTIEIVVDVKNTGKVAGKEVVQVYVEAPQGKLAKPYRVLVGFAKTKELAPGEKEQLVIKSSFDSFASYCEETSEYILEKGVYNIVIGTDVRSASQSFDFELSDKLVLRKVTEAMAPVLPFEILPDMKTVRTATVDMRDRRLSKLPQEIPYKGEQGITIDDVKAGKNTIEEFVSQLDNEDLACIVRGEGMGSSRVTAGTAAAFGGVSDKLIKLGLVPVCCDDGPSGLRLDSGAKAFSLPIGTLIACSFNTELTTMLYECLALEMISNNVECILGPGMNIHRSPLNGRNFEYFSEDPFVTGKIACAQLDGLHKYNVTGTIKHFCGNNQELSRYHADSVISERALREIYLKGFEMAVKDGKASSVMTTYGSVNGLWTAGNYDLCTTILREEWGFKGIVMTDWWALINDRDEEPNYTNFAAMVRAQNDLYMVTPNSSQNTHGDNILESLEKGTLTRGELTRSAVNICNFVMNTNAMDRPEVEILNRPKDEGDFDAADVEYTVLGDRLVIDLTYLKAKKGTNYVFAFDVEEPGEYTFTLKGKSDLGALAQLPCTLFYTGIPMATFTFNGTEGKMMEIPKLIMLKQRFAVMRLYVADNGLELTELEVVRSEVPSMSFEEWLASTRQ